MKKNHIILFLIFVAKLAVAQVPAQQFWSLNQPHYIILNSNNLNLWSLNGGATISGTQLNLTDNIGNQTRSVYYKLKMNVRRDFVAKFTYTAGGNRQGNGFTFVLQNQSMAAIGPAGNGGALGYTNVTPSIALAFDYYANPQGVKLITNGVDPYSSGAYTAVSPVVLNVGNPIDMTISYNFASKTFKVDLAEQNTTHVFSISYSNVNIPTILNSSFGWVGFTGATGAATATQTISNFVFK